MSVLTPAISLAAFLLRQARISVLSGANMIGVNRALGKAQWRANRLLILCYHGVSIDDEHEWSDLYVSPQKLEHRLALLKTAGASILPLTEALERLESGTLPPRAIALTFDDGGHDFSRYAAPMLGAAKVPATVYLTTYYCNRPQPVFDTVTSYLLWKARGRKLDIPGFSAPLWIPMKSSDKMFNDIHHRVRMRAHVLGMTTEEKDAYARTLALAVGVDYDRLLEMRLFQIMSAQEVSDLDSRLIDVQLHTHRHRSPRDRETFLAEIEANRAAISNMRVNGAPLEHFCYPSGDYVPEYRGWLSEAGVKWATTCDPGLASRSDDQFLLPRVIDAETVSDATFQAWISGLGMFAYLRRRQSA